MLLVEFFSYLISIIGFAFLMMGLSTVIILLKKKYHQRKGFSR